jgi:hypothetical protein
MDLAGVSIPLFDTEGGWASDWVSGWISQLLIVPLRLFEMGRVITIEQHH